ncbi:MAG: hypothetical protein CMF31_05230 [Kordiimonas sp.]|nr:hypothetical protein [Kordiimonas sp.]|tara:strand:- start:3374 stop:4066 length:693 start_codon:yes stop_codon:yes gene_type:complete
MGDKEMTLGLVLTAVIVLIFLYAAYKARGKQTRPPQRSQSVKSTHADIREDVAKLARALLSDTGVVYLDAETTDINKPEIVELAILNFEGKTLFNQRINPATPIRTAATEVHGIKKRDLKNCPTWPDVHKQVDRLLLGKTVIIYNADFDVKALKTTCDIHGLRLPRFKDVCLMKIYASYVGEWNEYREDFKWHKLTKALRDCGLGDQSQIHRAEDDARHVYQLVQYLAAQ